MNELEYEIRMMQLTDDRFEFDEKITPKNIQFRKRVNRLFSDAVRNAKPIHCKLCKKACSSFCNSHSIPRFALTRIAENGMVSKTLQNKMPLNEKSEGVNQTGTFHLICGTCDNECFQDYENPQAYSEYPTNKMIAQIALKNYLLMIYKRLVEIELFTLTGKRFPESKEVADEKVFIENLDLQGYYSGFEYAQKAINKSNDKYYHLLYYRVLDYVVPYAAQSAITLVSDFEDEVINDLYNFSPNEKMKEIHVAVFPLETTSVVLLFVEEGDKRYRKFYKQLKKLSEDDQLSAINYIVFSNIENVFLNPSIQKDMRDNQRFVEICGLTTEVNVDVISEVPPVFDCPPEKMLSKAVEEFSLSKRHLIPNLLSKDYAISTDKTV